MKDGKPIIPPFRQTSGIITYASTHVVRGPLPYSYFHSQPEPFTCDIKPRSEKAAVLIQHTVEHR